MAPLQKRSLYALLVEVLWAVAIIMVFISQGGAGKYNTSGSFRLIMDGMWVGGLILYWWLFSSLDRRPDHRASRKSAMVGSDTIIGGLDNRFI